MSIEILDIGKKEELFETYIEAKERLKQILESEQMNFNQFKTEF